MMPLRGAAGTPKPLKSFYYLIFHLGRSQEAYPITSGQIPRRLVIPPVTDECADIGGDVDINSANLTHMNHSPAQIAKRPNQLQSG